MASVVKINVLTVPPEMREELERRFAARAGMVESADGFEWFELLRPVEGTDRYLVYTRWRSEEDFQRWLKGQAFERGHGSGERAAATASELWSFEVVESAGPARA
ncbi:antibiotic biosynthesis monooxygenase family protein [Thermoactinospora rubra]|uniref:antibiotic biosynthesis monooxygenase family protein n=1 Tax=Thermoactinospora rubra TaxID=1088767 RepID=UPI000A0F7399|nr:antibiotic biosynthesis monooxygenase [Thermoactinospora rubra]